MATITAERLVEYYKPLVPTGPLRDLGTHVRDCLRRLLGTDSGPDAVEAQPDSNVTSATPNLDDPRVAAMYVASVCPQLTSLEAPEHLIVESTPDYEVARLVRALLAEGRLRTALTVLQKTTETHPDSKILAPMRGLLRPARARYVSREIVDHSAERMWLREHANEYRNQWVAIRDGQLLAYGTDSTQVRKEAITKTQGSVLLVKIDEEGRLC